MIEGMREGGGLRSEYELLVGLSSRFISLKLFQSTFHEYNAKGTDYLHVFGSEYEFHRAGKVSSDHFEEIGQKL